MRGPVSSAASLYRRLARDRSANFAVMTALSAPVALALTAFAIDEGSLFTERRAAQSLADLAAIAAAANIGNAEAAAITVLKDNGLSAVAIRRAGAAVDVSQGKISISIVQGHYTPDPETAASKRFEAGKTPYNAAEISLHRTGTLFFGGAFMDPPVIGVKAVAHTSAAAAFSIGSRLAKFKTEDSPLLDSLFGGLLGSRIALTAMDYNALLDADINILSFLDQLAVKLDLTGVSYADVLDAQAGIGQMLQAMADVPGLDARSRSALKAMALGTAGSLKLPLGQLVDLGPAGRLALGQRPSGLSLDASALHIVSAAAMLANDSRQIAVDTGIGLPGLLDVTLLLAVGEPPQSSPWLAIGEKGAVVRTAQTRLKLVANIGASTVSPGINLIGISVPLNVEIAYAQARLEDISCPTGRPESRKVSVAAQPGIAELRLAQDNSANFADFTRPQSFGDATIAKASIDLLLLKIKLLELRAQAQARMGDASATRLVFDDADINAGRPRTVTTRNYTGSLTSSLIGDLKLTPYILGARVDLADFVFAPLKSAVMPVLDTVTSQLDPVLVNLLSALGIALGEADVRVTGTSCGRAVLVQ